MVLAEVAGLLVLVLIGLVVVLFVGALLFLLPAIAVAVVVWLITHNELLTGAGFLAVALVSLAKR